MPFKIFARVAGVAEEGFAVAEFDDAAEVHDAEAVGHVADDGEVVADEEVGEAEALLEIAHEVEDLGLDGDVEGGGGFVADEEVRFGGEGAGDGDALALAAGEFVGVFFAVGGGEADLGEELADAVGDVFGRGEDGEGADGFGDDVADAPARVERGVGVLEDHVHFPAQAGLGAGGGEGLAFEGDVAGGGAVEADGEAGDGGFAAAGFADEGEGGAFFDGEGDVIDGAEGLAGEGREDALEEGAGDVEVARDVGCFEDGFGFLGVRHVERPSRGASRRRRWGRRGGGWGVRRGSGRRCWGSGG